MKEAFDKISNIKFVKLNLVYGLKKDNYGESVKVSKRKNYKERYDLGIKILYILNFGIVITSGLAICLLVYYPEILRIFK